MQWVRVWIPMLVAGLVSAACDSSDDESVDVEPSGPDASRNADVRAIGDVLIADAAPPDARFPACRDGRDNDGDGFVDLEDSDCESPDDDDERAAPRPAACDDGRDNDDDGFTDFPDDPGCGSMVDDDEFNDPVMPECNDGLDNDNDGFIDEIDPGCVSVADPNESDPFEDPACSDGVDNDEDGVVDFPNEPGCSTSGDDDESDPATAPDCVNGLDDDGDGRVDFPDDPGCAGAGDRDETDKVRAPDCADEVDNDRDGKADYPDDDGCYAASDWSERGTCGAVYDPPRLTNGRSVIIDTSRGVFESEGTCGGTGSPELVVLYRLERPIQALRISTIGNATQVPTTLYVRTAHCLDAEREIACQREEIDPEQPGHEILLDHPRTGSYFVFVDGVAGRGGPVEIVVEEIPLAQCLNELDDDNDGRVDYPFDPGCAAPDDRDETSMEPPPLCSNDEDDDDDGRVDFPLDVGCSSAADEDERDECGQGIAAREYFFGQPFVMGNTDADGQMNTDGSCGGRNGPEVIFRYYNPVNARLVISTAHPETETNTVVYVRRECRAPNDIACDDGGPGGATPGRVVISRASVGAYWVVVDTKFRNGGPFKLTIEYTRLDPNCDDGADNDADGLVDGEDPGCESSRDADERDLPGVLPVCGNERDDDEDGLTDFPADPGCATRGDPDEVDLDTPPACANGEDDDRDLRVDYPFDPGCRGTGDDSETDPLPPPACGNRIDDDADGLVDYPIDPGCVAAGDSSERDPVVLAQCTNEVDDDRDGISDFPFDPGCSAASDPDERDPETPPVCSNGVDDDEDGIPDFPRDYGCRFAGDPDETGSPRPPRCANGRDDDQDDRVDFPDDPGCRFAADESEINEGGLRPRCADGVDNDFDGQTDLQDLGCADLDDDDEEDPEDEPRCGNGADDDEDGLIDWPADPGCQARGSAAEDQSCRPDVDVPLIAANSTVIASTRVDGADNYENRCGGQEAPDAVYRYVLDEPATLRVSADNPETDYRVVLSVRRDCEEPTSMVDCAGHFAAPEPTVVIPDADPGEYYIFVDGSGPDRIVSSGAQVEMPIDPRGYAAQHDLNPTNWVDGGRDAFDNYGRAEITFGAEQSGPIDVSAGERNVAAGGYSLTLRSDWAHQNVWRLRFDPDVADDDRLVTLTITGNMGSDSGTVAEVREVARGGHTLRYLHTADDAFGNQNGDPAVIHFMVPGHVGQLEAVRYETVGDAITITAADVRLPIVFYVAPTFADHEDVISAIAEDLVVQAGPGGEEVERFGRFELTVEEQREVE